MDDNKNEKSKKTISRDRERDSDFILRSKSDKEREELKNKCKEIVLKSKREKSSSRSSSSSSSSESSSSSSSSSSRSSSSRKRKHKKHKKSSKSKKQKKKESKKKSKRHKESPEKPKKSKWTTVNSDEEYLDKKRNQEQIYKENSEKEIKKEEKKEEIEIEKEKPNFKPSGILAKETNTVNGVEVKFTTPLDAAIPTEFWRLYPFRDNEIQEPLHIHKQTNYLVGKDKRIANILVNHPSCSRQHSVIQYREFKNVDENGKVEVEVKPYIMDLGSTNGTFINKEKIEPARYYELKNYDLINFGFSTRDYIITKVDMKGESENK